MIVDNVVTAYDVARKGNRYYFVCNEMNCLVLFDGRDEKYELIDSIPEEGVLAEKLVSEIIQNENHLILIPLNAHKIWIYDLDKKSWTGIDIKEADLDYKFMSSVFRNGYIYLLPCRYKELVIINSQSYEVEYIDISFENRSFDVFFRSSIVVKDDYIYAACCSGDYIFRFDMKQNSFEWLRTNVGSNGYSGIAYSGGYFVISSRTNSKIIYIWKENNSIKEIELPVNDKGNVRGIVSDGQEITLFRDDCLITVNQFDFSNPKITNEADVFYKVESGVSYRLSFEGGYTCKGDGIYNSVKFILPKKDTDVFINQRMEKIPTDIIYEESNLFNLSNFLKIG